MEIPTRIKNFVEVGIDFTWSNPNEPETLKHLLRLYRGSKGEIVHLGPLCKKYKGPQGSSIVQETLKEHDTCPKCLNRYKLMFPEDIFIGQDFQRLKVKFGEIAQGYVWNKTTDTEVFHAVQIIRGPDGSVEMVTPVCQKRLTGFVSREEENNRVNCAKCLNKIKKGRGLKLVKEDKKLLI